MPSTSRVLNLTVERAGRRSSYQTHGADSVLVGSGSHCDVRLSAEDAASAQLRIELRDGEIYAESLAPARECLLAGLPFLQGNLTAGFRLQLGQSELQIELARDVQAKHKRAVAGGLPTPLRILGFAAIGLGLYWVLQDDEPISLLDRTVDHPGLFAAAPVQCAAERGDDVVDRAQRLIRRANLLGERAPFHARDGISAVADYSEASACFERAQQPKEAATAQRSADVLRRALSDEFHLRHVRLERLLKTKKYDAAQRELRILQDFLNQRDGAYAQWLAAVQRELNTRFASAPKQG